MNRKLRIIVLVAFVFSMVGFVSTTKSAAAACSGQFVAETQHCVPTLFWNYWNSHGGLAQQGYPVSEATQETASNGKQYLTQYFERAVFEYHPENAGTAYEVLLAQLGTFRFHAKYPNGAAGTYNWPTNNHNFSQTGQTVGGKFYDYWANHGGLAQQGYPISGVFQEKSDTNGQTYYVQYFERAEFEWHQENAGSSSEVLLTLLGTQRYAQVHNQGNNDPCAGVKDGYFATITPKCGKKGTTFTITLLQFAPDEKLSYWFTDPQGNVIGTQAPQSFGSHGGNIQIDFDSSSDIIYTDGDWAITFQGEATNVQSIAYFRILK